jgi:2-succinyl-5-enolpyruvyl-6-hydroxy-3-cyclohexene-1-carboxylate synthase
VDIGELNLRWADALLAGLVGAGLRHAVISPGSRSTPLALACARQARIIDWVIPDERSAAFFALGLSRATGQPCAVISTSGSAPANWFPAVIEASQDLQPLLLLSADRPAELQGCGANQTIDQLRLFGAHVRDFVQLPEPVDREGALRRLHASAAQAIDRSRWPTPGPVHLNVPLHEPLVPAGTPPSIGPQPAPIEASRPTLNPDDAEVEALAHGLSGRRGLIVCGRGDYAADFADAVTRLAGRLDCPILADPLSGLRFGPHDRSRVLTAYDAFLRRRERLESAGPDWVLRLGAAPVSKALQQYLDTIETETTLVSSRPVWPDPDRRASRVVHADPAMLCHRLSEAVRDAGPAEWIADLRGEDARAARLLDEDRDPPLDLIAPSLIARCAPEGSAIFCGNSMVIRDVDTALRGGPQALRLVGNRGASGIDGNVSTTLGLAAGWPGPVVGLVGDLALYHDMNGLLAARDLNAVLVVFNNGGGAIFEHLPQRRLHEFERYWLTPSGLEIAKIAELYRLRHARVADAETLEAEMRTALARSGVDLIEIAVDRAHSVERHRDYWRRVAG